MVGFSVALCLLAAALPAYASLTGDRAAFKTSLVPAACAGVAGVGNFLEDGLSWSWASWAYVGGVLSLLLGLLGLAVTMALRAGDSGGFLAAVPVGTLLGLVLFEPTRGVVMLMTWVAAAVIAVKWRPPAGEPPRST